jgi:4-diphosphocytidyl-2-C-methyl-D-erythritol kinase
MRSLHDLPAPAKLNLFLHIVGRREDGYHLLQSAFALVDWCDLLHLDKRPGGALSREDIGQPVPADDLCLRAARALQAATGCTEGVHITLDKRLPAQAGMGGGSSDAATCLLGLNRLWGTGLDQAALEAIGLQLGADVPFFLRGRNAWVEGIGERITPIALPAARLLVVKPGAGVDTASIFRAPDLHRATNPAILSGFAADPLHDWLKFGHNDLQPVARRLCPDVGMALDWLASLGLDGRMTGSGSACFAPLHGQAEPVVQPPAGWAVRACSILDVHPLVGWASSDKSSVEG